MSDFRHGRAHTLGFQNAARVRQRMRDGLCVGCPAKKRNGDLHHQRCRRCRRAHAEKQRARHATAVAAAEALHGPKAKHFGRLSDRERRLLAFGIREGIRRERRHQA